MIVSEEYGARHDFRSKRNRQSAAAAKSGLGNAYQVQGVYSKSNDFDRFVYSSMISYPPCIVAFHFGQLITVSFF